MQPLIITIWLNTKCTQRKPSRRLLTRSETHIYLKLVLNSPEVRIRVRILIHLRSSPSWLRPTRKPSLTHRIIRIHSRGYSIGPRMGSFLQARPCPSTEIKALQVGAECRWDKQPCLVEAIIPTRIILRLELGRTQSTRWISRYPLPLHGCNT